MVFVIDHSMSPFVLSKESPYFYTPLLAVREQKPREAFSFATYNAHFGAKPNEIAEAIRTNPRLNGCDVIAIQEIEAHESERKTRAEMIAGLCGFDCVYAPARNEGKRGQHATHGLAILSRYPLEDIDIFVLPRYDMGRRTRRRICLTAKVIIDDGHVRIYNVHLDTRMSAEARRKQLEPIVRDALRFPNDKIIIAGDVNTIPVEYTRNFFKYWGHTQRILLDAYMKEQAFNTIEITKKDYTLRGWGLKMMLDAIYTRNLPFAESGIEYGVKSSDHFPMWAKLGWE